MLADLDELVLSCRDKIAQSYFRDAVSCYNSGAFLRELSGGGQGKKMSREIAKLKKAIPPLSNCIESKSGVGYKFIGLTG